MWEYWDGLWLVRLVFQRAVAAVCLVAFVVALNPALVPGYENWFGRLVQRLLAADPGTLKLVGRNPWAERPPRFLRAVYYLYRFADPQERRTTGAFWQRTRLGEYLPAVEASSLAER